MSLPPVLREPDWVRVSVRPGESIVHRNTGNALVIEVTSAEAPPRTLLTSAPWDTYESFRPEVTGPHYIRIVRRPPPPEVFERIALDVLAANGPRAASEPDHREEPFADARSQAERKACVERLGGPEIVRHALVAVSAVGYPRDHLSALYAGADRHTDDRETAQTAVEDRNRVLGWCERAQRLADEAAALGVPQSVREGLREWSSYLTRSATLLYREDLDRQEAERRKRSDKRFGWKLERTPPRAPDRKRRRYFRTFLRSRLMGMLARNGEPDPVATLALVETAWLMACDGPYPHRPVPREGDSRSETARRAAKFRDNQAGQLRKIWEERTARIKAASAS